MSNIVGTVLYSRSGVDTATTNWLYMEQAPYGEARQSANFSDLTQMFNGARGGLSARSYHKSGCNSSLVETETVDENGDPIINVLIELPFYIYTPIDEVDYVLEPNHTDKMSISEDMVISLVDKSGTFIVPMQSYLDLQARIEDNPTVNPDSTTYDTNGDVIPFPGFTVSTNRLEFGTDIFSILWLKYRAIAHAYVLSIVVTKQEGSAVTNIKPVVVASWDVDGETMSKTLEFTIPDCVYNQLTTCPEEVGGDFTAVQVNPPKTYAVYYSSCHGRILGIMKDDDRIA